MRLIFVRHGEPDYQKDCLTETGRIQAELAAIGHILNLPFPYVCGLLHMDFTGITILRFERHAGIGLLPCLELGSDSRHIMGTV